MSQTEHSQSGNVSMNDTESANDSQRVALNFRQRRAKFCSRELNDRFIRENHIVINSAKNFQKVLASQAKKHKDLSVVVFDISPHRVFFEDEKLFEALDEAVTSEVLVDYERAPCHEFKLKIKRYLSLKKVRELTDVAELPPMTLTQILEKQPITECDKDTEVLVSGKVYKCTSNIVEEPVEQ